LAILSFKAVAHAPAGHLRGMKMGRSLHSRPQVRDASEQRAGRTQAGRKLVPRARKSSIARAARGTSACCSRWGSTHTRHLTAAARRPSRLVGPAGLVP
jgi:hypothetical protein